MATSRSLLAICAVILGAAIAADACTSGSYDDPRGYISFRLLDLPSTYLNSLAFVPAGTQMQVLPVAGKQYSSLGKSIRVKNSFVCMTASEDIIQAAIAAADAGVIMDSDKWPGSCSDGMNDKGLHVAGLMQFSSTGINEYNTTTGGPAVEQIEFINFLLARYDDVVSIREDLVNGKLNPVLNPKFSIITRLMFGTNYSTLHYNIWDTAGNSMVIEYSGEKNLQWWDNKPYQGALANNPLWEQQIAYYNSWFAANSDPYITIHDSKFLNLPGSYNSSHRFIRAAKLPDAGYIWEWPKDIEVSPRYVVDGQPQTNPALMAVQAVMSSVWLPKGIDDAGGMQYEGGDTRRDIVWFAFITDHKYNTYYYRVANSPQWKRIAMDQVQWKKMDGCVRYMKLRGSKWWVDESNSWARSHHEARERHSAPKMTLEALKKDIVLRS